MSGARRAWLDVSPGERRGVVTLDGRPERLLIERDGDPPAQRLGARQIVRVGAPGPDPRHAFAELCDGSPGLLRLGPGERPSQGSAVEAVVTAEPRWGKGAAIAFLAARPGAAPALLDPGPSLAEWLRLYAPGVEMGVEIEIGGECARGAADEAEAEALEHAHAFKGGLALTVEPTRALVAVDVDRAGEGGVKARLDANLRAVRQAARLLRLKSLSGTIAIDLLGFPREAGLIAAEARAAFAPDGEGVVVLPPNRLGLLVVSKPHGRRPVSEGLLDADGRPSARTFAQRLVRDLERAGLSDPGAARVVATCAPEVASVIAPLVAALGPRFQVLAELGRDRLDADIRLP